MIINRTVITSTLGAVLMIGVISMPTPARASDAGAFVGGLLAGKVVHNMSERTQAEQQQAYYAQQQSVQQAAPAASSSQSTEQQLAKLDKLAEGGYITPAEYKAKRKEVLDSM